MNMLGNIGGALGPVVVGYILANGKMSADAVPAMSSWNTAFFVAAIVYGVSAAAWLLLDPVTPLATDASV